MLVNLAAELTDILPERESTGLESPSLIETMNTPSYPGRERKTFVAPTRLQYYTMDCTVALQRQMLYLLLELNVLHCMGLNQLS